MNSVLIPKFVIPAGMAYDGGASDVDDEGMIDLNLDTGEAIMFIPGDEGMLVEEVPQ